MVKIKEIIISFLLRREFEAMAIIYATLIIKGKKTFSEVPNTLKEQVKQILIDLDAEYLIQ